MPALSRGQASDCSNPEIDLYTAVNGTLTDVAVVEFQVWELVTDPENPVQVYPPSGRQALNLALCPAGEKVSTGRYVAEWTPPLTELIGTHEVRWFFKLTLLSPEQTFREEFEVLPEVVGSTSTGYTTVAAMRAEGVTTAQASDTRLLALIQRASRMIDRWTGRWFEPRSKTFLLDGRGTQSLLLGPPICDVTRVRILLTDFGDLEDVSLTSVRVYNRHLTQELLDPDDRENPRIDFVVAPEDETIFGSGLFPTGRQNIEVQGVFGYTDPDGSPYGRTPELIQLATQLLVVRQLPLIGSPEDRDDERYRGRVISLRTRDQEIRYASPGVSRVSGHFSGDPEIDDIIASYVRPPSLGAV